MATITLPPELERTIARKAEQQGTTLELLTLDGLRILFPSESVQLPLNEAKPSEGSMLDFLKDYVGVLHSGSSTPEGANLSEDTGERFRELLVEGKQRKNT